MTENSKTENKNHWVKFVLYVTLIHCVTYAVFGVIASSVFNYSKLFTLPVISDYYKPFYSTAVYLGPLIQLIRGLAFGFVLLPLRGFLKENKLGWLWLWLLFFVIGIIGTPAAAPSSIEGVIYSKIPLWFHLIGMPEMLGQTLLFCFLTHKYIQKNGALININKGRYVKSIISTCIAFLGYSIISVAFALASGVKVDSTAANASVMGQFIVPVVLLFVFSIVRYPNIFLKSLVLYLLSSLSIWLYQEFVLGGGGISYSLIAPVLPILILWLANKNLKNTNA